MSRDSFRKAVSSLESAKSQKINYIPGVLGFTLNGEQKVEVPSRESYVYVRLRGVDNEVIQAFNDAVAPVYNLPVLIAKDDIDRSRYRVIARDTGAYANWGSSSAYLPKHGHTHSFIPEEGGGGDVVWAYSRQLMPLAVYPSGSSGAGMVMIKPGTYYQNDVWHYAGGTATASLLPYRPTDNTARMVLVYLDGNGNPGLIASDDYFAATITGNAGITPYLPSIAGTDYIPLEAIRLVSGTTIISWGNIYDVRPWLVGDGFIATGTFAPYEANYVVAVTGSASLPNDRLLAPGNKITITDNGAGSTIQVGLTTGTINHVMGWFVGGDLEVGVIRVRNHAPRAGTVQNVTASVYEAPTGTSVIVDIHKNGTTIFTDQNKRPTIPAGSTSDLSSVPDITSFVINDEFIAYIDQVGSSGTGADLQVQMRYAV